MTNMNDIRTIGRVLAERGRWGHARDGRSGTDPFEIGRFSIRPVWTGCGVEWQWATRTIGIFGGEEVDKH